MSKKVAVKALRQLFENKKSEFFQEGRLVAHLYNELGNKYSKRIITLALESMERDGEVTLARSGKVLNGVTYNPKPQPQQDLDKEMPKVKESTPKPASKKPWSPLSRDIRERTRGMADYLDDSQCSEVIVRRVNLQADDIPVIVGKINAQRFRGLLTPENLTLALQALRLDCNDEGVLATDGVTAITRHMQGCAKDQASLLFTKLGKLGVKVTDRETNARTGVRGWQTYVDMNVDVITQDMLDKLKAQSTGDTSDATGTVVEAVEESVEDAVVVETAEESPAQVALTPEQVLEKMADIIGNLEAQLTEAQAENRSLVAQTARSAEQMAILTAENERLQSELDARRASTLDPRYAEIMRRYAQH